MNKNPSSALNSLSHSKTALAAALLTLSSATIQAADYYWDTNGNTAGFGTASGTWLNPTPGGTTGWSADSTGASAIGSVTTATGDIMYFGHRHGWPGHWHGGYRGGLSQRRWSEIWQSQWRHHPDWG